MISGPRVPGCYCEFVIARIYRELISVGQAGQTPILESGRIRARRESAVKVGPRDDYVRPGGQLAEWGRCQYQGY